MRRAKMRENLFQLLYQIECKDLREQESFYHELFEVEAFAQEDVSYFFHMFHAYQEKKEEIEKSIIPLLRKDWSIERLPKVDLALLRLAVLEAQEKEYTALPVRVLASEVVRLAKKYTDEASRKFINGFLRNLLQPYTEEGDALQKELSDEQEPLETPRSKENRVAGDKGQEGFPVSK